VESSFGQLEFFPTEMILNSMNRITNLLFVLAFTIECVGLWLLLSEFESIFMRPFVNKLPDSTHFILSNKTLLLLIPIPFWIYALYITMKKAITIDMVFLLLAITTVVFLLLLFVALFVIMLPWVIEAGVK